MLNSIFGSKTDHTQPSANYQLIHHRRPWQRNLQVVVTAVAIVAIIALAISIFAVLSFTGVAPALLGALTFKAMIIFSAEGAVSGVCIIGSAYLFVSFEREHRAECRIEYKAWRDKIGIEDSVIPSDKETKTGVLQPTKGIGRLHYYCAYPKKGKEIYETFRDKKQYIIKRNGITKASKLNSKIQSPQHSSNFNQTVPAGREDSNSSGNIPVHRIDES